MNKSEPADISVLSHNQYYLFVKDMILIKSLGLLERPTLKRWLFILVHKEDDGSFLVNMEHLGERDIDGKIFHYEVGYGNESVGANFPYKYFTIDSDTNKIVNIEESVVEAMREF